MPVPCVKGNVAGLQIFQATADQRFALGTDTFLRTHLPVRLWARLTGMSATWTEDDLLNAVVEPGPAVRGNRVFLLFGAAGSGKSEVMRWLMLRLQQLDPGRSQWCVRINRTDLDPVRISSRILNTFNVPGLGPDELRHWDDLRRKPVALANQLVWQALASLFQSDEEILPLSYRLRPIVETNLRTAMVYLEQPDVAKRPLELLSAEQMEHALADTPLEAAPVYEHLRARLQDCFEQIALSGVRLVPALRNISREVWRRYGVRPLLLIDDLVQSMNVYASDLLDYLLTLEEGEWDVVLGLTPAAFEWDRRGRELMLRIRELDTVDDRVVKLELSDTSGDLSAFLTEETAADYLAPYLDMYKHAVGFNCEATCPYHQDCVGFQWGTQKDARLTPFNMAFIRRLWRHLPHGKGRARYLLLAARAALETMASGTAALEVLPKMIERDVYGSHPDPRVRAVFESYYPGGGQEDSLPPPLARWWELQSEGPVIAQTLRPETVETSYGSPVPDGPGNAIDPNRTAVRDWLEGGSPNPELLKPLRLGIARFARDIVDPGLLVGADHAQPNGAVRWSAVQHGVSLPIPLDGIDTYEGIAAGRDLGASAFDLVAYGEAKGATRSILAGRLLENPEVVKLIYRAVNRRKVWQAELAEALGFPVEELAFHLMRVALALGANLPAPLPLASEVCPQVLGLSWPADLTRVIRVLWEDCFRLRDHLYDGDRLERYLLRWPAVSDSLRVLRHRSMAPLPDAFRLCERPFAQMLGAVQVHLDQIAEWAGEECQAWPERASLVDAAKRLTDRRSRARLERRQQVLERHAQGILSVPAVPIPPSPADREPIAALVPLVDIALGPDCLIEIYRLSSTWARVEGSEWFNTVTRWYEEIRDLHRKVTAFLAPEAGHADLEPPPSRVTEILEGAIGLLPQAQAVAEQSTRLEKLREYLMSSTARQCRLLAELLLDLLPDGFIISSRFAEERALAQATLKAWEATEQWLAASRPVGDPPTPPQWDPAEMTRIQAVIRESSDWWASFAHQLPLLRKRGPLPDLTVSTRFLEEVRELHRPDVRMRTGWSRFLIYARRRGVRDLPVFTLQDRADLPQEVRSWFRALAGAGDTGLPLSRLSSHTLKQLEVAAPHWLSTIHLCPR